MWWAALMLVAAGSGASGPESPKIHQLACVGTRTIIATDTELHLQHHDGARWHPFFPQADVAGLWRTPDGRVLAHSWRGTRSVAVEITEGLHQNPNQWILPADGRYRFELVDGNTVAVSVDRRYRLDPRGAVFALGETPLSPRAMRPQDPPVLLRSGSATVVCLSTSLTKAHDIAGHCVRIGPSSYDYRAEFGGSAFSGKEGEGVDPFLCGDVVISARRGGAQSRRFKDGVQVGTARLYPRHGSQCLPGERVLIVSSRDVAIFALPQLRPLWRRSVGSKIRDAVLCGRAVNVIGDASSTLTAIDLPGKFGLSERASLTP